MDVQIENFENTLVELRKVLGSEEAANKLVSKALFSMSIGANDFLNNYVNPFPDTSDFFLPSPEFNRKVITKYRTQLTVRARSI